MRDFVSVFSYFTAQGFGVYLSSEYFGLAHKNVVTLGIFGMYAFQ
jgi:hypothetical protein